MPTIWKFPIPVEDRFAIEMPRDAEVLHIEAQHNHGWMWARVAPERKLEVRRFLLRGTGHPVDMECRHLGSFMLNDGALVFHVFEESR